MRHLLPAHQVVWVNTIGTRTPRFDLETFRRAAGKFRQWFGKQKLTNVVEPLPENLTVHNPRMWPWLTRNFDRRLNGKLLLRQLEPVLQKLPTVPVAVTTLPIVADLMSHLPVAKWVYYCVDDFSQWPGLDRKTMGRLEHSVVERADTIIAVSENLQQRLAKMGRTSHLLTHGVDVEFWKTPGTLETTWPKPWIVFWGVVDQRMDVAFMKQLANDLTEGTILLVGPEQGVDTELLRLPRVQRLGPMSFKQLPALAHEAAVLVMPYADQPVTRAMQPLKLKEYLATGKPTVARDLPANREWAESLDLVSTPTEFSARVRERLVTGLPAEHAHARQRLTQESWAAKARMFAQYCEKKN
jgi:glycosyltransferase involved in cell wall biosynthesis